MYRVVSATHYIYICEPPTSYREKSFSSDVTSNQDTAFNPLPRGSLKSLRKASYDIKSISNDSKWDTTVPNIGIRQYLPKIIIGKPHLNYKRSRISHCFAKAGLESLHFWKWQ